MVTGSTTDQILQKTKQHISSECSNIVFCPPIYRIGLNGVGQKSIKLSSHNYITHNGYRKQQIITFPRTLLKKVLSS